jgi:signal peptidase
LHNGGDTRENLSDPKAPGGHRNDAGAHTTSPRKNRRLVSALLNFLFYAALVAILAGGLLYGTQKTHSVFGFSFFMVLTGSMEREIPEGSLVIVKQTEPNAVEVGDDITFLSDKDNTITHRVIRIYENYEGSGARGFVTKGLENPMPDAEIVYADNMVGRVVFHLAGVGDTIGWIRSRWTFLLGLCVVTIVLCGVLKVTFSRRKGYMDNNGNQ